MDDATFLFLIAATPWVVAAVVVYDLCNGDERDRETSEQYEQESRDRLESNLDFRFYELAQGLNSAFDKLEQQLDSGFDKLEQKLDSTSDKQRKFYDNVESLLERLERKWNNSRRRRGTRQQQLWAASTETEFQRDEEDPPA